VDESLLLQSKSGFFRADLSGLLDLEGYYIDQRPPALIFPDDQFFFNPRLSLFVDTRLGKHFYSLVQARFDRGFDPGADENGDARVDEYLLRYTPFDDARLNLQVGKFATVVGNWVPRHLSWDNPFINAPLPYENVLPMTDHTVPPSPAPFLARKNQADRKALWLPLLWGPAYTAGASVFGAIDRFDYAFEFKNASVSSRPAVWDPFELGWAHPTYSGRLGYRPGAAWNLGISASGGTYLLPEVDRPPLPAGKSIGDYNQFTLGHDVQYAWHHWQFWAEVFLSRFAVPTVGDADTLAYYLEAKYKITPRLFAGLRWNQQFFGTVRDGLGGREKWDQDAWRIDAVLGFRFTRHLQTKLQYSYNHQEGDLQQGEQLAAAQLTVKF
jgi:hypothetical protein